MTHPVSRRSRRTPVKLVNPAHFMRVSASRTARSAPLPPALPHPDSSSSSTHAPRPLNHHQLRPRRNLNSATPPSPPHSPDPNPSRVPCTNIAAVSSRGKCAVLNSSGRCGGCRGYDSSSSNPSTNPGSAAASIEACRPPYECPPRNTRPETRPRIAATAARSPC